jgi:hypothetical protein
MTMFYRILQPMRNRLPRSAERAADGRGISPQGHQQFFCRSPHFKNLVKNEFMLYTASAHTRTIARNIFLS